MMLMVLLLTKSLERVWIFSVVFSVDQNLTERPSCDIKCASWHADASALSFEEDSSATKRALFFMVKQTYSLLL